MKRVIGLLVLLVVSAAALTGCLQINISTGIDNGYNSFLTYRIKMDVSQVDAQYHEILKNTLNNWGWHFQQEQGFTASASFDQELYTLTMTKTEENDNLTQAFQSLKKMLSDENVTPFLELDMNMMSYPLLDSYVIEAMTDIRHIIERAEVSELTPEIIAEFEKGLEESGGAIELTIPVSDVIEHSHETNMLNRSVTMTVPLSLNEPTEFILRGDVVYTQDGTQTGPVGVTILETTRMRMIVIIGCACVLAVLLIVLVVKLAEIRRFNKFYDA